MSFNEKFIDHNIAILAKSYDSIRGANVNIQRFIPDIIDGLKPVQRRTLYVMYLKDNGKAYRKVASISGDTFGRAHPHSPVSIETALVGMAQWWHNSIPLIDGEGNFGAVSGEPAGASRYIKARLSEYAQACFFEDWKDSVVDMEMSYDEETLLPIYLPAKYPNVLLNGCNGIGYGLSSNLVSYNFKELINATIQLILNSKYNPILIPDSPTGASIIENDFANMCNKGIGKYTQRCTYEIDPENNLITITSLPEFSYANDIREKIATIKDGRNGLSELIKMDDLSGKKTCMKLFIRDDVNPYKFMRKLIKEVAGLERTYPVNITITNNYQAIDYNVKEILLEWIKWRRDQKRTVVSNKRTTLFSEQRINDIKIFLLNSNNLDETIKIFRSNNRNDIERKLIEKYRNSDIKMDSLQARTLSNMRMIELNQEAYQGYLKKREELKSEIEKIEKILNEDNGIDRIIIEELKDGIKRFGTPRKSSVVPRYISVSNEIEETCILQLNSDGIINRRIATNVDEEPIPTDSNGFAVLVNDQSSFVLINDSGFHTFIKVKDIPLDADVPVMRYCKKNIDGKIIAMLPVDIEQDLCCTLISKKGQLKRFRISDLGPSKKPCIMLDKDDKLVKGILTKSNTNKDLLIYTLNGMGQRIETNSIRITSPNAKGLNGFNLNKDDEIIGCFAINHIENSYLLYLTQKGKARLNSIEYLPVRENKYDKMFNLINISNRDKLLTVIGCNRNDKVMVYNDNGTTEIIDISKLNESTMNALPEKILLNIMANDNVLKAKLM